MLTEGVLCFLKAADIFASSTGLVQCPLDLFNLTIIFFLFQYHRHGCCDVVGVTQAAGVASSVELALCWLVERVQCGEERRRLPPSAAARGLRNTPDRGNAITVDVCKYFSDFVISENSPCVLR